MSGSSLPSTRRSEDLAALDCEIVDVSLPHTEYAVADYYIIAPAEASSNLARYDGVRYGYRVPNPRDLSEMYSRSRCEGFGAEVKRRIMIGTYALSSGYYDAYYRRAMQVRTLIKKDYEQAFERVDALVTPVSPTPPFKIGEKADDPLAMYLSDIFTVTANLAGIPSLSIPCGVYCRTVYQSACNFTPISFRRLPSSGSLKRTRGRIP